MTDMPLPGVRPTAVLLDRGLRAAQKLADAPAVLRRRRFAGLRAEFYDTLWRDAAAAIGAEVRPGPDGLLRIVLERQATFVGRSDLMLDSAVAIRALADKALTYDLLSRKGWPVPDHVVVDRSGLDRAATLLVAHPGGIVAKPASGTGGGRGVTTSIRGRAELARALRHAARFNPRILVEPHLSGRSFRLLYLDGALIDAVRRDPPVVTGDGRARLSTLVARENARRLAGRPITALSPLVLDADARNHLAAQGRAPGCRPGPGEAVQVKAVVNENAAAQNHSVLEEVHPALAAAGERLVRDLGLRFAGLDVIAPDLSRPLEETGGLVSEININPGLHHHVLVAGPAQPVAARILDHLFATGGGVLSL